VTRSRYRTWHAQHQQERGRRLQQGWDLERDEEGDGFDRVVPAVDIVAHEEVVCVGRVSADPKQLRQVVLEATRVSVEGVGGLESKGLTNWPWMSPQTVTGHRTGWTLLSSVNISRALQGDGQCQRAIPARRRERAREPCRRAA
jgi:hypothetical protein